ncbi:SNF1 protein kinase subunit beta-1 [Nakaseomyces bracarensis]|uniref:SNF1 protein kinase subunit beta-1 n=1 Tax=Nakaseomyces bracarensis TaxID=273131 RepID=A0ABR4NU19_9SACH
MSLFKENYSVTREKEGELRERGKDVGEDIDVNMAGLSLTSSIGETRSSSVAGSLHISSPGPSNATVQTILRDVSQQDDTPMSHNEEAAAQLNAMNEHRPSIVALKMSLKEVAEAAAAKRVAYQMKGLNSVMNSSQRSSVSASSRDEVFVDASPVVNRTPSIDIPRAPDGQKQNFYNGVKSSNHFPYRLDEGNNTPLNVDPDAGMLQGADVVLNQELLEKALKRDMKRKRTDTMQSSTVALNKKLYNSEGRGSTENTKSVGNSTEETSSDEPLSATAAMMMRLYGDPTLMEQQRMMNQEQQNKYVHKITNAAAKKNKPLSGKRKILSNPNLNLQPLEPLRPVNELGMFSAQKIDKDQRAPTNEQTFNKTNVILKWRDNKEDPKVKETKVYLVSREICASLQNREKYPVEYIQRNEENFLAQKIPLEFDVNENEWFVPNLYLPPGIYRFQFLVNGNLRHSDFLPTATDEQGNIVNWFEVLRGYEKIEPYRDEAEIQSGYASSAETTLEGNDSLLTGSAANSSSSIGNNSQSKIITQVPSNRNQISRNSSYYSAKSIERPFTPYSDYTGISRSNSIVGNNSDSGSAMMNRNLTLDFLPPPTSKTYSYSTKIPALFRISGDSDDEQELDANPRAFYDRPSFTHRVVDCNQDALFGDLQKGGKMDAEEAENLFLKKYAVPDLPVYLNSTYLNKIFHEFHQVAGPSSENSSINHIIPHVNLKHLLTSSIRDGIVSVACTTRYAGKFITQVIYAPCDPVTGGELDENRRST